MKNIEETRTILSTIKDKDPVIDALITVLDNMIDAGDGDIAISDNNVGISITGHSIDIVDINHSKSILTITIK